MTPFRTRQPNLQSDARKPHRARLSGADSAASFGRVWRELKRASAAMICFFLFDEGSQNGPTGAGSVLDETGHNPSLLAVHASESMSQNPVLEAPKLTSPSDAVQYILTRSMAGHRGVADYVPAPSPPLSRTGHPALLSAHTGRAAKLR